MPANDSTTHPAAPATHAPDWRIGVDTGGTFTDLVLLDPAGVVRCIHKCLSTPGDPAQAVLRGIVSLLDKADVKPQQVRQIVHGSTVATNALLEHRRGRVAFVTTAGFEDTLFIARQNRPRLYDLVPRRPDPPVERAMCFGLPERMDYRGRVIQPLQEQAVVELAHQLKARDVQAVAVSLLHSYANPAHEQQVGAALRGVLGADVHLTLSHELLPEFREYERASTCVINAAVGPRMVRYITRLSEQLGAHRLRVIGSHGGTLPVPVVCREPIRTVLSGPAGGLLGGRVTGQAAGHSRLITLDMGGTSADVALCTDQITLSSEGEAGDLPTRVPMVDLHTVGAGGGSIAWKDAGGALRVGPQSAGADPGPACYGRQPADQPPVATVTDAHVVLGHIPRDLPLAGSFPLDHRAAHRAVAHLAAQLDLDIEQTARGIIRVVEATMARAIGKISLQRGHDPRQFTLMPFGGAGGLHACSLAETMGMTQVLLPPHPGLLSAAGMLAAPPSQPLTQTVLAEIQASQGHYPSLASCQPLNDALKQLQARADAAAERDHIARQDRRDRRQVDLRYAGQSYEITIDLAEPDPLATFAAAHHRLYGYAAQGRTIEVVNARHLLQGRQGLLRFAALPDAAALSRTHSGPVQRDQLRPGDRMVGPALIIEYSATTRVPAGWGGQVLPSGAVHLTLQPSEPVP